MRDQLYQYLLSIGDNSMILGHRLSELCGHGPSLETDIALTNISLDLFGQVRSYFQYAAELKGEELTEDKIAFLRYPNQYRNALLVEQPNKDFAYVIVRQFLFDAFHKPFLEELSESLDPQISAIAQKSLKEVAYHLRFSSQWMIRLGDGTEESHEKMQEAVNYLYRFSGELFEETEVDREMKENKIGADLEVVKEAFFKTVQEVMAEATLEIPETPWHQGGGKKGIHTEQLGYILADLQYMQRTYPDMKW